jgi:UMF1 family MFS transporter
MNPRKKIQNAWGMYDWANSTYNLVISSAIFPIFYGAVTSIRNEKGDIIDDRVHLFGLTLKNTEALSYALAFSLAVVSVLVPLLSGIADYYHMRKRFLQIFCYIGAASCASLYFFDPAHLEISFLSIMLACIGFWCSYAFANSFLPQIANKDEQDRVSARAYSMGYIGSVSLLIMNLIAIKGFGMSARWSFVSVGVWWAGFAQITFYHLKEEVIHVNDPNSSWKKGFTELKNVWNQMSDSPSLKRYLVAFFVFSMGIQTIMQMAAFFGEKEINLDSSQLIVAIVLVQLIAIPGAILFSWGSKKLGNIKMLMVALLVWVGVCVYAFYGVTEVVTFYIAAGVIGFIMGGTQSLARSTYSKFLPVTDDTASFFSFYDVTEKLGLIIGLFSFGFLEGTFGTMRASILALVVFFILGFLLLTLVPKEEKR